MTPRVHLSVGRNGAPVLYAIYTMFAAVVALAGPAPSLRSLQHPGEVRCPGCGALRGEHLGDPAGQQRDLAGPPVRRLGARRPAEHVPGVVPCRAGLPALAEAVPPQRGLTGRLASVAGGYEPPPGH